MQRPATEEEFSRLMLPVCSDIAWCLGRHCGLPAWLDRDDVAQEGLVGALEAFRGTTETVPARLFTYVSNAARWRMYRQINRVRAARRDWVTEESLDHACVKDEDITAPEYPLSLENVGGWLAELPRKSAQCLRLWLLDGRTLDEVGAVVGMTGNGVRFHTARGIKLLRKRLGVCV